MYDQPRGGKNSEWRVNVWFFCGIGRSCFISAGRTYSVCSVRCEIRVARVSDTEFPFEVLGYLEASVWDLFCIHLLTMTL
jgi:hypothetical protein